MNLFFWTTKTPQDNAWHPLPSGSPITHATALPKALQRLDPEALAVDAAPFITLTGGLAHIRQLPQIGFTAHASVFRNTLTMTAMHRAVLLLTPLIFGCQALGVEYRDYIPRWAHERERGRDEESARRHVDAGMGMGVVSWVVRMYVFRVGRAYWAPLDLVMGGALADLMNREYFKTHGFE